VAVVEYPVMLQQVTLHNVVQVIVHIHAILLMVIRIVVAHHHSTVLWFQYLISVVMGICVIVFVVMALALQFKMKKLIFVVMVIYVKMIPKIVAFADICALVNVVRGWNL